MTVPHPFPYQGSKRHLASTILAYFPAGSVRLIEPFAGSAAVGLAGLYHGMVESIILADTDAGITKLWQAILTYPEQLIETYRHLWQCQLGQERHFYNQVRARFNKEFGAGDFLYLLLRCVKASVRYNANGEFNQSPDHRRRGTHPDTVATHIRKAARLLQGRATIYQQDFTQTLKLASQDDVIYLDPPYQGVSSQRDKRYKNQVDIEHLVCALTDLNRRGIRYILSYDGRTGDKSYGTALPSALGLHQLELSAGRSTQATLLGRADYTTESLYLSPTLSLPTTSLQLILPGFS